MNPVNWFEIPVTDLDRAENFYKTILGIEGFQKNEMGPSTLLFFPGESQGAGAMGALVKGPGAEPSDTGSLVYLFAGDDLNPALERVEANGGRVVLPKTSIGEWGFIAHFIDCEGNKVALHSMG